MAEIKPPSEHQEQSALIEWFDQQYRQYKALLFSIPNGSHLAGGVKQRSIQAGKLKRSGQRNGVPDLMLPIPSGGFHGLFIEMKRIKGGTVSAPQKRWLDHLNGVGYKAVICKGFEEAREAVECYLSTTTSTTESG